MTITIMMKRTKKLMRTTEHNRNDNREVVAIIIGIKTKDYHENIEIVNVSC